MKLFAAALAGACLATSPLYAADLFGSAPPPMPAQEPLTELGANWYIRGDIGYGSTKQETVNVDSGLFPTVTRQPVGDAFTPFAPARGNAITKTGSDISLGFGYRINDWMRAEANWTFSRGPSFATTQQAFCPEVASAVNNYLYTATAPDGIPVAAGYQYSYNLCNGNLNVQQYNNTGLVMGYADLGHYWLFSPYIGVGGGINVNTLTGSLDYKQTDTGATYQGATVSGTAPAAWVTPVGTDQNGRARYGAVPEPAVTRGNPQPVGPANWHRSLATTKYTFALAAAAGIGVQISQSATMDIGYKIMMLDATGGLKGARQAFTIGMRYNLN